MPLFCDAFIADTQHLTLEEAGAYMKILMVTWRNNGVALPDDAKRMCRTLSVTPAKWAKLRESLVEFFDLSDGNFRQKRLEKEWSYVNEKSQKNRSNGSLGGRPKLLKNNDTEEANGLFSQNHTGNRIESETKAPIPIPIKKERTSNDVPKKSRSNPKTPIHIEWVPDGVDIGYAQSKGHGREKISAMAEGFSAHHTANGSVFSDWHAAWRTWVLNDAKFAARTPMLRLSAAHDPGGTPF